MRSLRLALVLALALGPALASPVFAASTPAQEDRLYVLTNPAIDMPGYLSIAHEAARHRAERIVTEREFFAMSGEPGTIVLDARSRDRYDLLHVAGAVNLPFPDIAIDSLAERLPDRNTRILIYCNNNFSDAPVAFASKTLRASLNLSTFIALYTYGYRNVYELGPLIDIERTLLPLESFTQYPPPYASTVDWNAVVPSPQRP